MKWLLPAVMLSCFCITPVYAQQENGDAPSLSDLPAESMSPEMWFYLYEQRRQDDPKQAVRRRAEIRANERQARIAAMRWYGYSNQRPQAAVTPFMGTYSPAWTGNSWNPYHWMGGGHHTTHIYLHGATITR